MNNFLKYSLIALPVLVGGYIVYRQLKPKKDKAQDTPTPTPIPTTTPIVTSGGGGSAFQVRDAFPLKKGSRGAKVKELQNAILVSGDANAIKELGKSGADGDFGGGTERAVKLLLGKTSIDSQSEIDNIKNIVSNSEKRKQANKNRIDIANKLVAEVKKGGRDFYTINDIQVSSGSRTSDGRDFDRTVSVIKKGSLVRIPYGATYFIDKDGFIRATTKDKFWEFSPYGMQVK